MEDKAKVNQRLRGARRGAALVEFALVAVIFLMLVVGIFEFGRAMWVFNTLEFASARGARYAMVRGEFNPATAEDIERVVRNNCIGLISELLTVNTTWNPDNSQGSTVRVEARYTFDFIATALFLPSSDGLTLFGVSERPILR